MGRRKYTYDEVKSEFEKRNYNLLEQEYINSKTKMKYICKNHPDKIQTISFNTLTQGHGCYYCGLEVSRQKRLKSDEQFKKEIFNLVGDEFIPLEKYDGEQKKIKFLHNIAPPHTFIISPNCFLDGQRCSVCSSNQIYIGINDMWTTAPKLAELLLNPEDGYKYMKNSSKKINWLCPHCKNIIYKSPNMVNCFGLSCKNCSDTISYPNKLMHNILMQLNIEFIPEYSPKWIKPKRYDFYIPKLRLIIEMDGSLGHGLQNKLSGISGKESLYIDQYKDMIAKEHGINVVRIDCRRILLSTIKSNIINKLSSYLKIEEIDWVECNTYALKPISHEIIKLWNLGLSVGDICKKTKYGYSVVRQSLLNGAELNTCNYNISESKRRAANKNKIVCLNNKMIFDSSVEAAKWCNLSSLKTYNTYPSENYKYAGRHPETKEKLYWMKYDEYLEINDENINEIITSCNNIGKKKVVCLNNNKIFNSITEAGKWCGLQDPYSISKHIKGKAPSAGKDPITQEPLRWAFYNDYIKKGEYYEQINRDKKAS